MIRSPIVSECKGCTRTVLIEGVEYCLTYPNPAYWWTGKKCPMKPVVTVNYKKEKRRAGQQHQKKMMKVSKKSQATYVRLGK